MGSFVASLSVLLGIVVHVETVESTEAYLDSWSAVKAAGGVGLHSGRATVKGVLIGTVGAGSVVASEPAEMEGALLEVFDCQIVLLLVTWNHSIPAMPSLDMCLEAFIDRRVLCTRRNSNWTPKEMFEVPRQ